MNKTIYNQRVEVRWTKVGQFIDDRNIKDLTVYNIQTTFNMRSKLQKRNIERHTGVAFYRNRFIAVECYAFSDEPLNPSIWHYSYDIEDHPSRRFAQEDFNYHLGKSE